MRPTTKLGSFSLALYAVGAFLMVVPVLDIALRSYPMAFGNMQWRFAFFGLLFTNTGGFLLGFAVLGVAAALREDARLLRGLSLLALVAGACMTSALVLYVLDTVQVRMLAPAAGQRFVLRAGFTATVAALAGTVTYLTLGVAALKASRGPKTNVAPSAPPGHVPLYVGARGGIAGSV